jgi:acetyl-CoA synthetase
MNQLSVKDIAFWEMQAHKLPWFKQWKTVLEGQAPFYKWFNGGTLNASRACLDVHLNAGYGNHTAILWEDELGNRQKISYQDLYEKTNKIAATLRHLGVTKNDTIVIYLSMIPDAIATMLAIARLGAINVVVFSGFSAEALYSRIVDVGAKIIVTTDVIIRRGKQINLKNIVDKALSSDKVVQHVLVFKRNPTTCTMQSGRDIFFDDIHLDNEQCFVEPEAVESNHPLFVLYTSGSTGKPKGIMHSTGGYLTYVYSTIKRAFDIDSSSIYWCTADIGWITGHSYVVFGPLMHGSTIVIYDGAPDSPTPDIWWQLIERYKVSIFYTAPTALRFFMKIGSTFIDRHDLSSLKLLGSVGEPLNPQVWTWYHTVIGKQRCPIVDTWWQTETGGFMIAPKEIETDQPGSVGKPLPGIDADVVNEFGISVAPETKGFLVIKKPWPGMLLGFFRNSNNTYQETYWTRFKDIYFSGDYAIKDTCGNFFMLGRADEVLNISGHRVGTAEIESAMLTHKTVAEAAAIGVIDEVKGEVAVVFVVLREGFAANDALINELIDCVHKHIGKFVTLSKIHVLAKLPKTRSGKIMRRVLKAVVDKVPLGDVTTMEDESVIEDLHALYRCIQQ